MDTGAAALIAVERAPLMRRRTVMRVLRRYVEGDGRPEPPPHFRLLCFYHRGVDGATQCAFNGPQFHTDQCADEGDGRYHGSCTGYDAIVDERYE